MLLKSWFSLMPDEAKNILSSGSYLSLRLSTFLQNLNQKGGDKSDHASHLTLVLGWLEPSYSNDNNNNQLLVTRLVSSNSFWKIKFFFISSSITVWVRI